jgi:hypothetical protein
MLAMWRANPRAMVNCRGHTLPAGSAPGCCAHASAASMVTVAAPITSR